MITLFSPETFKTIPWKNGLGYTTELAISEGGSLDNFAWRLSIATVSNDGDFSNFAGYQRNLVLIEGNGLILDHRNGQVDNLAKLLDISHFDGASKTHGALVDGAIKDFNIMTQQGSFTAQVDTYTTQQQVSLSANKETISGTITFAYSLSGDMAVEQGDETVNVALGALVKIDVPVGEQPEPTSITGENMIIIQLSALRNSVRQVH